MYYCLAKIPSLPRSPPDSANRIQLSAKTRRRIQALPCLWHQTVQSTYYIISSVCVCVCIWVCERMYSVCVRICVFVVSACASMWPSGECVACSHAQGPDCKCCTCMWWLIATRHNRTLNQTKRRLSSYTWEPLRGFNACITTESASFFRNPHADSDHFYWDSTQNLLYTVQLKPEMNSMS